MSSSEWGKMLFSEICDCTTGKLNSNQAENDGEYPFFTCSPEVFRINNYAFDQDAVLLAGNNANGIFHLKRYSGKFNAYQRTYVINSKDTNIVNNKFVYYQLSLKLNLLREVSLGTATRFLTKTILDKIEFNIPNKCDMEFIADTLSCLDNKIELNNCINKTLEEIAQAIFKSWFVDFEPFQDGEFEDSELGRIPKGWRVDIVGNCTSLVTRGISPKYADISAQYVINQKCIRDGSLNTVLSRPHCSVVKKEKMLQFGDILINSTGVGTLGRVAQVYENLDNFTVDSHVTIVRPNTSIKISYLGCLLKNMQTKFEHAGTGSTGQTELGREAINQILILVPNDSVLEEFSRIYDSIYKKIVCRQKENLLLSNVRDSLLPKLMGGEIRIPIEDVQ